MTDSIKEMERKRRGTQDAVVDFDTWWMMRQEKLNLPAHLKSIVKADFGGRNLPSKLKLSEWDDAGKLFGLKI